MLANALRAESISRLTRTLMPHRSAGRFVGIDIGVDSVQVACLGRGGPGKREVTWIDRASFALDIDPAAPPKADLVDTVCQGLTERLPRCVDGEQPIACIALPLSWIHYETTTAGDLIASQAECDGLFQSSVFQSPAHLRHWPTSNTAPHQVIAATASDAACRIADAVAEVGYRVQSLLPHGEALLRSAAALTGLRPRAVVLLDPSGGLIATNRGGRCGLCRNLPTGHFFGPSLRSLDELEPWLQRVAEEINATLRFDYRLNGDRVDDQAPLMLCGSLAEVPGVDETLATLLGRAVAPWSYLSARRPRRNVERQTPGDPPEASERDAGRAVSLSLAHCAFTKNAPVAIRNRPRPSIAATGESSAATSTLNAPGNKKETR